jgi:hypothetical protein
MAEFYKRHVSPEFGDTSAAPMASLQVLETVERTIDELKRTRDADAKLLLQSQYQNAATRSAVDAYRAYPEDFDAYDREFTKNLRQSAPAVPLAEMGTYGAIANRTREHYYWTIAANLDSSQKKSLKDNYLQEYRDRLDAGMGLMRGQLLEPDQALAVRENLITAAATLGATAADGTQLFSPDERAAYVSNIQYEALSANLANDINPEISLEALSQLVDPNFNYTVEIGDGHENPMVFQKNDLPPGMRRRFDNESAQAVGSFLKGQNDLAALDHFDAIYVGLETFTPGDKGDRAAGELYAQMQMERTPFNAETLDVHTDNMRVYLTKFGFLPKAYAKKMTEFCQSDNPLAATVGATLIDRAILANPVAQDALDEEVVTRALLISSQIQGGTSADVAVTRATQTMDRAINQDRDAIEIELKKRKSNDATFYGGDVSVKNYGYGGVDFFRRQVDANFRLNGGNRDLAVKQALATTNSRYVKTKVGFYAAHGQRVANAPESVYGKDSALYIDQILGSLRQEITKKTGMPFEVNRLKLVATPETERAIETNQTPAWLIVRVNGDGTTDYYINQETGRPMTFSLAEDAQDEIFRYFHTLPTMDPMAVDGAGAFFNFGVKLGVKLSQSHPLQTVREFFQKIWSRKNDDAESQQEVERNRDAR